MNEGKFNYKLYHLAPDLSIKVRNVTKMTPDQAANMNETAGDCFTQWYPDQDGFAQIGDRLTYGKEVSLVPANPVKAN